MLRIEKRTGPSVWSSYLVNGDASGLTREEIRQADAWIEREGVLQVVSIAEDEEERFTWAYQVYNPMSKFTGGSVIDYLCEIEEG